MTSPRVPLVALAFVLLSVTARAQGLPTATPTDPAAGAPSGPVVPSAQAAANEDATALVTNPAGLGYLEGLEVSLGAFGRIPVLGGGTAGRTDVDALFAVAPMPGFALGFGTGSSIPIVGLPTWWTSTGIAFAADRTLSTGLALRTVTPLLGGGSTELLVDAGMQLRFARFLSVGAAVEGLGEQDLGPASGRFGLSVRPIGELLTFGLDTRLIPGKRTPLETGYVTGMTVVPALSALVAVGGLTFGLGASVQNLALTAPTPPTVEVLASVQVNTAHLGGTLLAGIDGLAGGSQNALGGVRVRGSSASWASILPDSGRWLSFPLTGDGVLVNDKTGFIESLFSDQPSATLVLAALDNAAQDPGVEGIVVQLRGISLGWGRAAELRAAFKKLKDAGKKVVVHMDSGDDIDMYIASVADKVYLTPAGDLDLNGLRAEKLYFADTLAKIGVRAEAIHAGKYKSAPRTVTANEPSEEELEVDNALLDEAFHTLVSGIAAGRGLQEDEVKATIDIGGLTAKGALEKKMVDGLAYADELEKKLEEMQGHPVHLEEHFLEREETNVRWDAPPKIALIPVVGTITMGRSGGGLPIFGDGGNAGADDIIDALDAAAKDDDVKAIVLRIDSPGGDALASDLIWRAVMNAKTKKPVIASMGDVAASGGYYIAAACSSIWAEPDTITGSIGVFGILFEGEELADKIGVRAYEVNRGALPGPSPFRPLSDAERASLQEHVNATYERFLEAIVEGRGQTSGLSKDVLREIAEGRVWTGNQAKERKLVDNIGSIMDTLNAARLQAGVDPDESISLEVFTGQEDDIPKLVGLARVLAPTQSQGLAAAVRLLLGDAEGAVFALDHEGRPLAITPARVTIR